MTKKISDYDKELDGRRTILYQDFKEEFDFVDSICDVLASSIGNKGIIYTNADTLKNVIWFLTGKSGKTFKGIVILCDRGYGEDALILTRSLFEIIVNMEYILLGNNEEKNHKAELYAGHVWFMKKKGIKILKEYAAEIDQDLSKNEENILKNCDDLKNKYPDERYWAGRGKNLKALVDDINNADLKRYYALVYWFFSRFAHATPDTADHYIKKPNDTSVEFSMGPSKIMIDTALMTSGELMLKILSKCNEIFGLGVENRIKELETEKQKVYDHRARK